MFKPKSHIVRILTICLAAAISAVNLKTFVRAGDMLPGGFMGLAVLIQDAGRRFFGIELPLTPFNILFNSIPGVISFKYIGKKYTLYSCVMIVLTSFMADLMPTIPIVDDVLLCAVFGGIVAAVPSTLCLLAGASGGGTDFISIFLSEKKGIDGWNVIFIFNMCILAVAGILFGWEAALYSIIFQYVAKQMLQTLYRRYQKATLFIVTTRPELAYQIIKDDTNHDATRFEAVGCYSRQQKTILYSVISADEATRVTSHLKKLDKTAFVNVVKSDHVTGNFYNKPKD